MSGSSRAKPWAASASCGLSTSLRRNSGCSMARRTTAPIISLRMVDSLRCQVEQGTCKAACLRVAQALLPVHRQECLCHTLSTVPDPQCDQRLRQLQSARGDDVVPGLLDGHIEVSGESDAHAVVDLHPVPPDARG